MGSVGTISGMLNVKVQVFDHTQMLQSCDIKEHLILVPGNASASPDFSFM